MFSDLSKLRLPQNFEAVGVTPVLMAVPVRKPNKTEFVRVHPEDQLDAFILETDDRETYFVPPECRAELGDDLKAVTLFRSVTRQGDPARCRALVAGGIAARRSGADGLANQRP